MALSVPLQVNGLGLCSAVFDVTAMMLCHHCTLSALMVCVDVCLVVVDAVVKVVNVGVCGFCVFSISVFIV